ncbi:hypothetical protein KC19_3G199500 [Ceratodon purpureus]|uniref:Uncharacterized protein n=1 Tax=Ceratodon purpureus TaxID=3225 RepID=A0A8T0IMP1_CERPU|nr:hypothetical protein KC19_3G199500 [Ceratodon purpureus]
MASDSTQISLDAAQVEEGINVIDLPPHHPLLMVHRVHHLVLLHVPYIQHTFTLPRNRQLSHNNQAQFQMVVPSTKPVQPNVFMAYTPIPT